MSANLILGWDIRNMSYPTTVKEYVRGNLNLLRKHSSKKPETFAIGKVIINRLRGLETKLECSNITGKTFLDWDDFQDFIHESNSCKNLIKEAINVAGDAVTSALRV